MPIYEYFCPKCKREFELRRSFAEADKPSFCPQCGSDAERLISVFASKVGFYVRAPEKGAFRNKGESTLG